MKQLTPEEYAEKDGTVCPFCGSANDINRNGFIANISGNDKRTRTMIFYRNDIDECGGDVIFERRVHCGDCDNAVIETFALVGYRKL